MTAAQPGGELQVTMEQLLRVMVDKQASDMHLTVGNAPLLRIDGQVLPLKLAPLTGDHVKQLVYSVLTEEQKVHFERSNEVDFSFGIRGVSRFRANAFMQRTNIAGVFRQIPLRIPAMDELGLPQVISDICNKPRGVKRASPKRSCESPWASHIPMTSSKISTMPWPAEPPVTP